ncbi:unnamed protein product [Urochloa humidicola]
MRNSHLRCGSLHPPSHGGADLPDAPMPSWVFLDFHAYFSDRRNSAAAACMTRDGKVIQVTFFPAHPPRVSYFRVHCQGVEPSGFAMEPKVLATHGNVLLLRISIGSPNQIICPYMHEYYVYKASGGADAWPSLELLPHPSPYFFYDEQVGILSHSTRYTVVALRDDVSAYHRGSYTPGEYDVCLLDSEIKIWTTKDVFVPLDWQQQASNGEERFGHESSKVITIGGKPGTMAFVDLSCGILLFDVLQGDPMLRYFTMPPQLNHIPGRRGNCYMHVSLLLELQMHARRMANKNTGEQPLYKALLGAAKQVDERSRAGTMAIEEADGLESLLGMVSICRARALQLQAVRVTKHTF